MVVSMSPATSNMRFLEVSASFVDPDMFPSLQFPRQKKYANSEVCVNNQNEAYKRWPRSQHRHFVCLSDPDQASTNAVGSIHNLSKDRVLHTKELRRSKKNVSDSSSARFLHQPSISREVPWDDGARRAHGYTGALKERGCFGLL